MIKEEEYKGKEIFKDGFYRHLKRSYPFLQRMNYAREGSGIAWRHQDFPGVNLIFTTSYEKCREGNRPDNPDKVAYLYYNKDVVDTIESNWDDQRILDLSRAMQGWEPFTHVHHSVRDWSIKIASRVGVGLPRVPFERNLIAAKWFLSTFLTDDPLEKCMEKGEDCWPTAQAFLDKFNSIYDGRQPKEPLTMAGFEGPTPRKVIEGMNRALDIHQNDLEPDLRKNLDPESYKKSCEWAIGYGKNIEAESKLFKHGMANGEYIDTYSVDSTRVFTIGYFWIVPPFVADPDMYTYCTTVDPLSKVCAWICAQDNDIASGPKDQKVDGLEFSPVSRVNFLMEEAQKRGQTLDLLSAVRICANDTNRHKMDLEDAMAKMDPRKRATYFWQYLLLIKLFDYHMVASISCPNDRYGWEPYFINSSDN